MNALLQDVKFALRMLAKSPGFTAIAVLTLALGIGANTAIFSLLDQVLLQSLPVTHPHELVELVSPGDHFGHTWSDGIDGSSFSYPMYKAMRGKITHAFSGLLATYPVTVDISGQGASERVAAELVSGNYFDVLGVAPALGRVFSMNDETASGGNPVVVLSYGFWARHFGSDANVLNRALDVNGTSLTIVGVAHKGYEGIQIGSAPGLFIPITMKEQMAPGAHKLDEWNDHWAQILGRMKPGFTIPSAEVASAPIYHALLESEIAILKPPATVATRLLSKPLKLIPGSQGRPIVQRSAEQPLLVLMIMVGLVLLIACANLASLLAARGEARQREMAVRLALGAGRGRLIRQLLTEGFVLALAGGSCGLIFASWTIGVLLSTLNSGAQILGLRSNLDDRLLFFAFGVSALATVLFALAPALRSTRVDLQNSLKEQGTSTTSGKGSARLRQVLIVAQVALTAVLLAASGLFVKSLINLDTTSLGLKVSHVLQFSLSPNLNQYKPEQTAQLFNHLRAGIAQLPGVRSVAVAMVPIFQDTDASANITAEGYTSKPDENTDCQWNFVSPGYFSAMGIPLITGREFTEGDTATSVHVAVINENLARKFFAGRDPIGQHLWFGSKIKAPAAGYEIVGVVANSKHDDVRAKISPFMYFPYAQDLGEKAAVPLGFGTFYVRTAQNPVALTREVRHTLAGMDSRLPMYDVRTLSEQVDDSMFQDRLLTFLSLALGSLAGLLAVVGLYGVMTYVVARRTREIGIRIALGAQRGDVRRIVLGQGAKLALMGGAGGTAAALGVSRYMASLLFGVSAYDAATFAGVAILLTTIALAACWIPARRAMKVDPMAALRYE